MEKGSFYSALDASDRTSLSTWVSQGDVLVISADTSDRDVDLINGVFGFSVSGTTSRYSSTATRASASELAGTAFEDAAYSTITGPNGNYPFYVSSLPGDATCIYTYVMSWEPE